MNISNINKLFAGGEFQNAMIQYQAYAISNPHMAKISIFNANIAKDKLNQELISLIRESKKNQSEISNPNTTDFLSFPRLLNFEPSEIQNKTFVWYKFNFVVAGDAQNKISKIMIPVAFDRDYLISVSVDFEINKPKSLICLLQNDDGLEDGFKGFYQEGLYSVGYSVSKLDPFELFAQLIFELSDLVSISSGEWLPKLKVMSEFHSVFGENPERIYFENLFKGRLKQDSPEILYLEKIINAASNVIKSQFGLTSLASIPEKNSNNVENLVNYKDALGPGINYHIEGVNLIANIIIIHGWIIDPNKQIKSIQIVNPANNIPLDVFTKPLRFGRPDVALAFNLPDPTNQLQNGFVSVVNIKKAEFFSAYKDISVKVITKNGNTFIEKIPLSPHANELQSLLHIFGALPDDEMNAERCEKFFRPIFTGLSETISDTKKVFAEDYGSNNAISQPILSVIIPLYGDIRFELTQIPTLAALQSNNFEFIFAVDDPRILSDVTRNIERLSNLYGLKIKVVAPDRNLGFAGINNLCVKYAKGKFLLFLNSDCFLTELPPLLKAIEWLSNPNHGAVGFRLLYADQTIQHDGMSVSKWKNSPDFYLNDHPGLGIPADLLKDSKKTNNITMLTGACLMMPKLTFNEIGGFNRVFIRGDFEDSDLCLKLISKGKRLGIVRSNGTYHLERQSIGSQDSGLRQKITLINSYIYSQRWKSILTRNLPALEVIS